MKKTYLVRMATIDRQYSSHRIEAESLSEFSVKVKVLLEMYPDRVLVDFEVCGGEL